MIIRQFLLWTRTAPPEHRAEAVGALARVALQGDLAPEHQEEAERALLAMLDDPSAMVRLAIAKAFAPSAQTPRPLLAALLGDEPEIAALVLEASPVLTDAELIDQAAMADTVGQSAIARRAVVSPGLAGAIAEVGCASAVLELLGNPGATIATISLARIVERFGQDALIRDVLLKRNDLPVEIRLDLVTALSRSLLACMPPFDSGRDEGWMQSTREARERTIVGLAQGGAPDVIRRIVAHLRISGEITPTLILRAALSGHLSFVQAVFAELTGLSIGRVSALLAQAGAGREALHDKAGLPRAVRPALLALLSALHEPGETGTSAGLSRRLIARALDAYQGQGSNAVLAVLHRYDNEAARDEARQLVRSVVLDASLLELSHDTSEPARGCAGETSQVEDILQVEFTEASEAA